jgi:hypothetical protein
MTVDIPTSLDGSSAPLKIEEALFGHLFLPRNYIYSIPILNNTLSIHYSRYRYE